MKRNILIAIPIAELVGEVKEIIEKERPDISIDLVLDEQKAKEKISAKAYALVVTHQHLPRDGKTPLQEEEKRGLGLSKWIDGGANRIPTILLTLQSDTDVLEAVNRLQNCDAVLIGLDKWKYSLAKRVRQALVLQPAVETKRLDVDIHIDLEDGWALAFFKGVNFACRIEGVPLNTKGSDRIISLSIKAAQEADRDRRENWQEILKMLGVALMRHVFEQNPDFSWKFSSLTAQVGGLKNTRIRFVVEKKVHAAALEAIFGPDELGEKRYWMLQAPIYRSIRESAGCKYPLFHEDDSEMRGQPINVLIIESPTEGKIELEGFTKQLTKLENVVEECRFLKKYLRPFQTVGRVSIGDVRRISWKNKNKSMKELLQKALEKKDKRWHIVHYAGHSYYDPLTQVGYIFFPGPHQTIQAVKVGEFSHWLRKAHTRFIFLSSCHSSEVGFVFALASQHIPAIAGFRWDTDDDKAYEYTKTFYQELMEGDKQSLEYAFLNARKKIYFGNEDNPIWAAPVLVIQVP